MRARPQKILFLDIDGVLNSRRTKNPRKLPYIVDPRNREWLRTILRETNAKIVLSSTWRYDPVGLLAAKHFQIGFIGITPDLPKQPRCAEIKAWLKHRPWVKRFAVLDDEDDELDELPLFQPDPAHGLVAAVARPLIRYLNGKTDKDMRRVWAVRVMEEARAVIRDHAG